MLIRHWLQGNMFFDMIVSNTKSKNLVLASPLKKNVYKTRNWLWALELVMSPLTYARYNQFTIPQNSMEN